MDFTLQQYEKLLRSCANTKQEFKTIHAFLQENQPQQNMIILRHDIDRRITNALKMAELEASLGIKATYYFRIPYTFKPDIIKKIASFGHEIGFHYETLAKTKGDINKAFELFKLELQQLRNIADIHTICMHGSPLSPYDNRDLWKDYNFAELNIIGEPYLTIDYKNIIYVTDTGRSWASDATNLRDRVESSASNILNLTSTNDLEKFLKQNNKTIIIQTHPERWAYSVSSFLISYGYDLLANTAKRMIRLVRKR